MGTSDGPLNSISFNTTLSSLLNAMLFMFTSSPSSNHAARRGPFSRRLLVSKAKHFLASQAAWLLNTIQRCLVGGNNIEYLWEMNIISMVVTMQWYTLI